MIVLLQDKRLKIKDLRFKIKDFHIIRQGLLVEPLFWKRDF